MRVLIAEDDRDMADVLAEALRRDHFTVPLAYDGESALEMARMRAVLRRILPKDSLESLNAGGFVLDVARCQVTFKGKAAELSGKEFWVPPSFVRLI